MATLSKLPLTTYHRAQRLGDGAFGAVCTVYNDNGDVYAMKMFDEDEDDATLDHGTIVEVSMLRMLRGKLGHPNLLRITDICQMDNKLCMVMPKFGCNLLDAIKGKALEAKGAKAKVAHGLLCAVSFLHKNGIMHRDIKSENVMLDDAMNAVLIDFSLAKFMRDKDQVDPEPTEGKARGADGAKHTADVGTSTYMAPEVYGHKDYDAKADVWSTGIVLLEMFVAPLKNVSRDKAAFKKVQELREKLPQDKPVPQMLRAMLSEDPTSRPSCEECLTTYKLFHGLNSATKAFEALRVVLPWAVGDGAASTAPSVLEQNEGKGKKRKGGKGGKAKDPSGEVEANLEFLRKALDITDPRTIGTAREYMLRCGADGMVDELDAVLLASRIYETLKVGFEDVDEMLEQAFSEAGKEPNFDFELDAYCEAERYIFGKMDYCLLVPSGELAKMDQAAKRAKTSH